MKKNETIFSSLTKKLTINLDCYIIIFKEVSNDIKTKRNKESI